MNKAFRAFLALSLVLLSCAAERVHPSDPVVLSPERTVISPPEPEAPAPSAPEGEGLPPSKDAYYHYVLGYRAQLFGKLNEALANYRVALSFDPDSVFLRIQTSKLLLRMGHVDEAVTSLEEAVATVTSRANGERPLSPMAAPLSDQDMEDVAAFFASLTPK